MDWLAYLGLFVSSFISATIVPFSSEATLSFLYTKGYDPFNLVLVASIGNTLGGMTGYYLGYFIKWKWLTKYFGIGQKTIEKQQTIIKKYGYGLAFLTWMPLIGDIIAVALGYYRLNWKGILVFMFLGKLARYILWLLFTIWGIEIIV